MTVLAVTDRSATQARPLVFGDGRGNPSYEAFTMQEVRPSADDKLDVPVIGPGNDPSKDFVTTGRRELDKAAFEATVGRVQESGRDTVVFVHGYNNSYQEAVFQLARLSTDIDARIVPIVFSWPSQATVTGYMADRDSSTYARDDLAQLLTTLSRSRSKGRVIVIGHSMGAWLVMESLRQLRLQKRNDVIARLQVGLAAPDIDFDVFRAQASVVGRLSPPLTVLVSADDHALAASSRLAGGKPRLGLARADDPEIQEIARQNDVRIIDITNLPSSDPFNHDRFITFAARYAAAAQNGEPMTDIRQAGVYLLDGTGRILSEPFNQTAQIIAGSR